MINLKIRKNGLCISGFADTKIFVILVVVIVLLAGVLWKIGTIGAAARNIKRNYDITNLQKALRLYNNGEGKFPVSNGAMCLDGSDSIIRKLVDKKYLLHPVKDPKNSSIVPENWPPSDGQSCYYYESDGNKYFIGYCMEGLLKKSAKCKYVRK